MLAILGVVWAVYGPGWRIDQVEVQGTRIVEPSSVRRAAEMYLQARTWLIIPHRTSWLLSSHDLGQWLKKQISHRLSIEGVQIRKLGRHRIRATVIERVPLFVWTNGIEYGTLDHQGVIIEVVDPQRNNGLYQIIDSSHATFQVDGQVLTSDVVDRLVELQALLRTAQVSVDHFIIPLPSCPVSPVINANENAATTNTNTSLIVHQPMNVNNSTNRNIVQTTCDVAEARQASQELHVQIHQGPLVMFDRHEDLAEAVRTLKTLLGQSENQHAQYVDLRFEQRVYIYP